MIFAVVSYSEEEQRVLSFLRYQHTSTGYKKLSTGNANKLLAEHWPEYLYYSRERDVNLHGVPRQRIVSHHRPRKRLREIMQHDHNDEIERKLCSLLDLFVAHGLRVQDIGVTGSLLIGAQNRHSDIDLVFYRREAFFKARAAIRQLLADGTLQTLDPALWKDAYERRGCSLTFEEFLWHEQRKFNKAAIEHTKFDISLLAGAQRATPSHYRKHGSITLESRLTEDRYSFDYPARYGLAHPSIKEVVSYTATYAGQARKGEMIEVQGQLEISAQGQQRIVVGTDREAPGEFIKVLTAE